MLKMGFQRDMDDILKEMTGPRQTLLFSATIPKWVKQAAKHHMVNPTNINATKLGQNTPQKIQHKAVCYKENQMVQIVKNVIDQETNGGRVIVFCETKTMVDDLARELGTNANPIHGDISQHRREHVMSGFKKGRFKILVATDVASRGLDIPEVELVLQTFFPRDVESYIHRSGRTGRAGKDGLSILLYTANDRPQLQQISQKIGKAVEPLYFQPPKNDETMETIKSWMRSRGKQRPDAIDIAKQMFEKYGYEGFAALIEKNFLRKNSTQFSFLNSEPGYKTIVVHNVRRNVLQIVGIVERILNYPAEKRMVAGRTEFFRNENGDISAVL